MSPAAKRPLFDHPDPATLPLAERCAFYVAQIDAYQRNCMGQGFMDVSGIRECLEAAAAALETTL